IVILGVLFGAVVYGFAWKFMGLTWKKEKKIWKCAIWGIQYVGILLKEIIIANLTVSKIVLSKKKKIHPVLVKFPAPLKSHLLQVILADSITLTPGTITVRLYEEKFEVHCLDESLAEGLNDSVFVKMLKKLEEA
ncbi:MAG: Na+/H+ antiporter subunit E, partial [Lachnospiraceae bacterium]|nr:Na+/H+ antiporter subunit E [Lachnospiraceae bacterium]